MFRVVPLPGVTVLLAKVAVKPDPLGTTLADKLIGVVKPAKPAVVILKLPVLGAHTDCSAGVAAIVKVGTVGADMVKLLFDMS